MCPPLPDKAIKLFFFNFTGNYVSERRLGTSGQRLHQDPLCSSAPAGLAGSGHLSQAQPVTLRLIIGGVLPNKTDLC